MTPQLLLRRLAAALGAAVLTLAVAGPVIAQTMAADDLGLSVEEEARALNLLNKQDAMAAQVPGYASTSASARTSFPLPSVSAAQALKRNEYNKQQVGPPVDPEQAREELLDRHCNDILAQPDDSRPSGPLTAEEQARERQAITPDRQLIEACRARRERIRKIREQVTASMAAEQAPLEPFGYDVFSQSGNAFSPNVDIPVPTDYVLGPGDALRVQLFGTDNREFNMPVSRDGTVDFPKLGPIHVAGLHFEQAKSLIEERVSREMIGNKVSVTLGSLRSMRVFVLGDVKQPGSYTVSTLATVTNALYAGGGLTQVGSLRRVQLKRNGQLIDVLDLYDLLLHGNSTRDYRLQPGDVVFVPPVGPRVSVGGAVRRPAIYELHGERTVGQVLALAGGRLPSGNGETGQIIRYTPDAHQQMIQLDVASRTALAFRVQDGDELRVREIAGPLSNGITAMGAFRYPGQYSLTQAPTLAQLLRLAQVLPSTQTTQAYYPLGVIERSDPVTGIRSLQSYNVMDQMREAVPGIPLNAQDTVIVFTRDDVDYLQSEDVRLVTAGDHKRAESCAGLKLLLTLVNSQRILQIAHEFHAEQSQSTAATPNRHAYNECPAVYKQVPQTLPYLLEQSVAVFGEVVQPGVYPVAKGASVRSVLNTAGGLTREGDATRVEYVSFADSLNNGRSRYLNLNLTSAATMAGLVSPGDTFNFRPIYLGQELGRASARGEFRFPGDYGLIKGERLSQMIRRAGGLTPDAYPYGAVFTRASARQAEGNAHVREAHELEESLMTATTSGALGELAPTAAPLLENAAKTIRLLPPIGRIVLQADPTVLASHPEQDIVLEAGDLVLMPKRPVTVSVIGQVLNEGTIAFRPGATAEDYLESAGGLSQAADHSRIFLVLPDGTARTLQTSFWNFTSVAIPPGSTIVVPRDATPFNALVFFQKVFGVFSNVAVTAAALATIARNTP